MLTIVASVSPSVTDAIANTVTATVTVTVSVTGTDKAGYMAALHVCPVRLLFKAAYVSVTVQEQTGVPT